MPAPDNVIVQYLRLCQERGLQSCDVDAIGGLLRTGVFRLPDEVPFLKGGLAHVQELVDGRLVETPMADSAANMRLVGQMDDEHEAELDARIPSGYEEACRVIGVKPIDRGTYRALLASGQLAKDDLPYEGNDGIEVITFKNPPRPKRARRNRP